MDLWIGQEQSMAAGEVTRVIPLTEKIQQMYFFNEVNGKTTEKPNISPDIHLIEQSPLRDVG